MQAKSSVPIEGQTIIVTGAAQGLGAAVARHLHDQGARLILMDRNEARLAEVKLRCPGAVAAVVDLSDSIATQHAIDQVCLLYTSPSPRDKRQSRMPSSA